MFGVLQPSDSGSVRKLLSDTKTLRQILEEAGSLLQMFWRAALPNHEETRQVRTSTNNFVPVNKVGSDAFSH